MNAVRERTMSIPIVYTGVPDNIAFRQPLPLSLSFTIRDQGKRLQRYKETAFAAVEVDLASQLTLKEGHLHIASDQIKSKIADQLQGTAKIQNIRPDAIECNYFTQHKKQVPVRISGTITPAPQYMFIDSPRVEPSCIYVYGRQSALDSVTQVLTASLSCNDLRDSLALVCALQTTADFRLSADSVTVKATVQQFTEKSFALPVIVKDVPPGRHLRTFPSTVQATVRTALQHFNDISENDIEALCRYPKSETNTLPVTLYYTDKHIIQARVTPAEVEYIIEH